jgi:putative toxin-antitoxin system antitoxin component (TIGR02293 family)
MSCGKVEVMAREKLKNPASGRHTVSSGRKLSQEESKTNSGRIQESRTEQLVTYQSVRDISTRFKLGRSGVNTLFGIAERTQFRYEKENPVLKPDTADRLARFNRIFKQAVELFEDEAEATHWLSTPKSALDGETPLSALATDAGAKKVEQILYRAEYGMFG